MAASEDWLKGKNAEWTEKSDAGLIHQSIRVALGETDKKQGALIPELVGIVVGYLEKNTFIFGADQWRQYFKVNVDPEPPLPSNLESFKETHIIVYVPQRINREKLTLISMEETASRIGEQMIKEGISKKDDKLKCRGYHWDRVKKQYGENSTENGYWLLITNGVLEDSRNKNFAEQLDILTKTTGKWAINEGWTPPTILEAIVCSFVTRIWRGKPILGENPWTFTRCIETITDQYGTFQVVVGGFASAGLRVNRNKFSIGALGVAASRKFL
jgi:hypothetical protein